LVLVAFAVLVFVTAATLTVPVLGGNYSTTMNINCTSLLANTTNITIYYNASGGAAGTDSSVLTTVVNTSVGQSEFIEATSITSLADLNISYNFSCYSDNDSTQNWSSSIANVTIDNTPPNVSTYYTTVDGGYYNKGLILLNVSVDDSIMEMDSVYFNITNASGVQDNFSIASTPGSGYYNITLDTSSYTDGTYYITVWANDTQLNNLNDSETITVVLDDVNPAVTLSSSSSTKTSLTIDVAIIDTAAVGGGVSYKKRQ
jgi:hypothetical protein